MFGTYKPEDVIILLKDITGMVTPLPTEIRERAIQHGVHYSEMLPIEYAPTEQYIKTYYNAVRQYASTTANAVARVSCKIWNELGENTVLVSLARAGTPVGILIKRYFAQFFGVNIPHYTISIIRGKGIDRNAMHYILSRHNAEYIQFVDGWIGKGAIQKELNHAMQRYPDIKPGLAVLSDPTGIADKTGTQTDFLIASSCLNATVSGLLSRTFFRPDIIGPQDYHGAVFYENLKNQDVTYHFIDSVSARFVSPSLVPKEPVHSKSAANAEIARIQQEFGLTDVNLIKPGIGESTRVLLRRVPWKILVHSLNDTDHLGHLYQLAKEKGVPLVVYPLTAYRACGLIQQLADN